MMITTAMAVALSSGITVAEPVVLLTKVQEAYRKGGDIQASFTQTFVSALPRPKRSESGKLWAKSDGRVRWEYQKPVRKYFIFDGDKAFFYEPQEAQVTVFDSFDDSQLADALRFLLGRGDMLGSFHVERCSVDCNFGNASDAVLTLWPKKAMASIDHAVVVVDPTKNTVRMSVIFDTQGNRTEYAFSELVFGGSHADKKFKFETPAGVQELRATLTGAESPEPAKPKR